MSSHEEPAKRGRGRPRNPPQELTEEELVLKKIAHNLRNAAYQRKYIRRFTPEKKALAREASRLRMQAFYARKKLATQIEV